jgi:hypothetical protein
VKHTKDNKEEWPKAKSGPSFRVMLANHPLHRIAARLRFLLKLKGYSWAANGDWAR